MLEDTGEKCNTNNPFLESFDQWHLGVHLVTKAEAKGERY